MRGQIAYAIAEAGIEVLPQFYLQYVFFVYLPETIKEVGVLVFILDTPNKDVFIGG